MNSPKTKFNESNNLSEKISHNKYAINIKENKNQTIINSISNINDSNNNINLLPLNLISNANSPIEMVINKSD